jgi:glutamate N-acetyltransferase/amino-acid N-acetyltransferase
MQRLLPGIANAAAALSPEGSAAAQAILTTDTCTKEAAVHGKSFAVGGMAKGSGMIHPNLATMLAVVTTDYPLEPGEPRDFLRPAVDESFNSISVDGECSTNDAVVLISSCQGERTGDAAFADALHAVCADLARQIVADGEGATVVAEISVTGAVSQAEAKAVARRIATSPLVKTALFGKDANWGRVLAAAGSAPFNGGYAQLDPSLVTLCYNGAKVLDHGAPQGVEPDVDGAACAIDLDLGLGDGEAQYLTSDLSYDYVRINADYRS